MNSKAKSIVPDRSNDLFTISNGLSVFRLLLGIPVLLLLPHPYPNRWAILGIFVLAYVTDLADGYVARHFNNESTWGRIIDPLADKIFVAIVALGLLLNDMIPIWYGAAVLIRDAVIFAAGMLLKAKTGQVVQSNMAGKVAVVSIGAVLLSAFFRPAFDHTLFTMLMLLSLGLMTASVLSYGSRFLAMTKKKPGAKKK